MYHSHSQVFLKTNTVVMITMPCVCSAATPNVCVNRRSTGWCSPSLLFYLSKYISDNISDVCLTLHGSQAKLLRAKLPIFCRNSVEVIVWQVRMTHMWTNIWLIDRCHQVDDYAPAKHLMTMCFTYYYMGKRVHH